ncbi:ANTAR domain-containing response regulator [Tyzzerella sp. An114]|uniref:ANTAR domain-containing response regulator n=1 Tax=Tyzzerella sp. An114 TaxID=1965545 RepID=UPI001FA92E36|nr:ANTAR domain-containing protein [Tyzzerella sp. An114]
MSNGGSALIVSGTEKGSNLIEDLMRNTSGISDFFYTRNGSEARRMLIENSYDIIIINTPLADEFGHDLALYASTNTVSGLILIVKSEIYEEVCDRVEDYGILVLSKPLSRQTFYSAVKLVSATQKRLLILEKENMKLQKKIEEIRLVDRAKCVLIQYLNMTEAEAHRYIEKQAMDMRKTKKTIAENILNTYDS